MAASPWKKYLFPLSHLLRNSVSESFLSHSPEETRTIAADFAVSLKSGDIIALQGNLGSGKTTFVQGIASGLGIVDVVNSPTFKIVGEYLGKIPLYHIDFYRIESVNELIQFGLDHYLYGDGVTVIEWADRFKDSVPSNIDIIFKFVDGMRTSRKIVIKTIY
ncbi:MAG: tRNA (adenosine(37)-N6)-threonylcarbamoyltransferase complex ATPase subunit type 1 TsaE [Candidatus Marinimicrobia bacterium]|nr:tRNA (adenosine(37)-N6)-threonylcarbamoyltransferase complex ATPase subunit type 1 TsaE [Candidatus Neomarinimicrobiota bacterium]